MHVYQFCWNFMQPRFDFHFPDIYYRRHGHKHGILKSLEDCSDACMLGQYWIKTQCNFSSRNGMEGLYECVKILFPSVASIMQRDICVAVCLLCFVPLGNSLTGRPASERYIVISLTWASTVYPKKYAHGFCFAVFCCGYTLTDFPISIRLTSLALWQSNDCLSANKATLMNMDEYFMWIHYERLHNHNKAKHNKTVCIFLGIYCMDHRRLGYYANRANLDQRYSSGWCIFRHFITWIMSVSL